MTSTTKAWIHSLGVAAIGGASSALSAIFVAPDTFNFTSHGLMNILKIALFAAVVPVLTLLKQSPLPPESEQPSVVPPPQKLGVLMLCSLLLMGTMTVPTTGCTPTQVVAEVNVVIDQATNIIAVADPGASWLPQLRQAVASLKAAEATWQGGGVVNVVISALNTVEAIVAVIPQTAAYAPLVAVLVAGIEAILIAFEPQQPAAAKKASRAMVANSNPYIGRAKVASVKDSKKQWNAIVDANPQLALARL